jgi:hypothetical protein
MSGSLIGPLDSGVGFLIVSFFSPAFSASSILTPESLSIVFVTKFKSPTPESNGPISDPDIKPEPEVKGSPYRKKF